MSKDYAVAPGAYLEEWLDESALTQQQLADRLGCSRKQVNELVRGRATVSPDTATKLERVTRIPAKSWLTWEAGYRADLARLHDETTLAPHFDKIPADVCSYLRAKGHTTATKRQPGRLVADFLAFHGCGTFEAFEDLSASARQGDYALAALKEGQKQSVEPLCLATWLRAAEETQAFENARSFTYDKGALHELLPALRDRCSRPDSTMLADARTMLETAGVLLIFVEPPKRFPLHGMTRWTTAGVPVIQQTGRRGKDGFIIWTLFHEIGHILNDPRGEAHLEFSDQKKRDSAAEKRANQFARETLFGAQGLAPFRELRYDRELQQAATELGVAPGLLVQQLHQTRALDYAFGNRLVVDLADIYSE